MYSMSLTLNDFITIYDASINTSYRSQVITCYLVCCSFITRYSAGKKSFKFQISGALMKLHKFNKLLRKFYSRERYEIYFDKCLDKYLYLEKESEEEREQ